MGVGEGSLGYRWIRYRLTNLKQNDTQRVNVMNLTKSDEWLALAVRVPVHVVLRIQGSSFIGEGFVRLRT